MSNPISSCKAIYSVFLTCFFTFCGVGQANAELIQVDILATVDNVSNLPLFGFSPSVGDIVTASFSYDSSTIDSRPDLPSLGVFETGHVRLNIGPATLEQDVSAVFVIDDHTAPTPDGFSVNAGDEVGQGILVDGVLTDGDIHLLFGAPDQLDVAVMPSATMLESLPVSIFYVDDNVGGGQVQFSNVRTLTVTTVPEPSGATFMGAVAVGLAFRRWSARRVGFVRNAT